MKRKPLLSPCVGCGTMLANPKLGRRRRRCADCRYALQQKLSRAWRLRHPDYHKQYNRTYNTYAHRQQRKAQAQPANRGDT